MYTDLCRCLASFGFVVVAMEHEDGSGSYSARFDGTPILYTRPDSTPYSREKVLGFRGPMLQQRVGEIESVLEAIKAGHKNPEAAKLRTGSDDEDRALREVLRVCDPASVALVGHSFGAASVFLAAKHLSPQHALACAALLDPWAFSLPDAALADPPGVPLVSVLSQDWADNSKEIFAVDALLRAASNAGVLRGSLSAATSVHQSFSDTPTWLPSFIGSRAGMMGRQEWRGSTQKAVAHALNQFVTAELAGVGGEGKAVSRGQVGQLSSQLREYVAWEKSGGSSKAKQAVGASDSRS